MAVVCMEPDAAGMAGLDSGILADAAPGEVMRIRLRGVGGAALVALAGSLIYEYRDEIGQAAGWVGNFIGGVVLAIGKRRGFAANYDPALDDSRDPERLLAALIELQAYVARPGR